MTALPADSLARLPLPVQWLLLLALSALFGALLELAGLPAALLLGPMAAAIIAAVNGSTIRIPALPYFASQTIVGCLVADSLTIGIVRSFLADWPLFIAVVLAIIAASSVLGWLMSRWRILPGSTAVWGASPGGATAMMLMAEAFGADARLVAFMQYLRVVFVAIAASLMSRLWAGESGGATAAIVWFPAFDWPALLETLAFAALAGTIGQALRIPAGPMLLPMGIGAILHIAGLIDLELPQWLLAAAYAVLGWRIGLGFTRKVLVHASRAAPKIVLAIVGLLAFCGGLAFILVRFLGIDPVTAYLATSPGGMDSVAIIAASSPVDLPFVMALQMVRFLVVLVIGPPMARFIARRTGNTVEQV